ncbi:hypothetical protein [Amnibacterium kyonggiense]|uniref:Uncharacterized protein n=1 Tax=Amnibacterium kyonggiense TaxID=595671 RepID=A0A4R7FP89_9MICO|nr:hypothetical protein [Amnibacterium kyonggiense]TDS79555.1 hypothetical protein CLV52_0086 [Amnibacterium kyonggiense]
MSDDPFDLDGRVFDLVSSTASRVDPEAPTRFRYHEARGVVWGEYVGDTVAEGRFVGTRDGARLTVSFVHALVAGEAVVSGAATSRIEPGDGGLRLVEDFEVDGVPQVSVCAEVRSPG